MTEEEKEKKVRELLLEEIEMLDGMIKEVSDQKSQIESNLRKLQVVRAALIHVAGEQKELDLDS